MPPSHKIALGVGVGAAAAAVAGIAGGIATIANNKKKLSPVKSTTMTAGAKVGDTEIQVSDSTNFNVGDQLDFGNGEIRTVIGFASILIDRPLTKAVAPGTTISTVPQPMTSSQMASASATFSSSAGTASTAMGTISGSAAAPAPAPGVTGAIGGGSSGTDGGKILSGVLIVCLCCCCLGICGGVFYYIFQRGRDKRNVASYQYSEVNQSGVGPMPGGLQVPPGFGYEMASPQPGTMYSPYSQPSMNNQMGYLA